jgi:hypothetical protein
MINFSAIPYKDRTKALTDASFKIKVDVLVTEQDKVHAKLNQVLVEDTLAVIGVVSKKKEFLPYADVINQTEKTIEAKGIEIKLVEAELNKYYGLFHYYVLNKEMVVEGESIYPLMVVTASYLYRPAAYFFGLYNADRNIYMFTDYLTYHHFSFPNNDLASFTNADIGNFVEGILKQINAEELLSVLKDVNTAEAIQMVLTDADVFLPSKKNLLKALAAHRIITVNKIGKLTEEDLSGALPVFVMKEDCSLNKAAWLFAVEQFFRAKSPDARLAKLFETATTMRVWGL